MKTLHFAGTTAFLALLSGWGCKVRKYNQTRVSSQRENLEIYRPVADLNKGEWSGRLILPVNAVDPETGKNLLPPVSRRPDGGVFIHITEAPANVSLKGASVSLKGKTVWLKLSQNTMDFWAKAATKNVRFSEAAIKSQAQNNVHPVRLDQLNNVSPLESLAGARAQDNLQVIIRNPKVMEDPLRGFALEIDAEPVQISGRTKALVKITKNTALSAKEGEYEVLHFNRERKNFDESRKEIVIIPNAQLGKDRIIPKSTMKGITLPGLVNDAGWYLYGEHRADGKFVVSALEPRRLMQLKVTEPYIWDKETALKFIDQGAWADINPNDPRASRGTIRSTLMAPGKAPTGGPSDRNQVPLAGLDANLTSDWRIGEQAILMHLFGGIGGQGGDATNILKLVTGHSAYGIATVVEDPFTGEPKFDIEYKQIYANNPDDIVAGSSKWHNYMGNLQRGWMWHRPVADALIKFAPITRRYNYKGTSVLPLDVFSTELERMMALYRIGNGTGAAIVTPAASCVQDSNQALMRALNKFYTNAEFAETIKAQGNSDEKARIAQLQNLTKNLDSILKPWGFVRSDWAEDNNRLAVVESLPGPLQILINTTESWVTAIPRRAYDDVLKAILQHDSQTSVWMLRSNQIGGLVDGIYPVEPTSILKGKKAP